MGCMVADSTYKDEVCIRYSFVNVGGEVKIRLEIVSNVGLKMHMLRCGINTDPISSSANDLMKPRLVNRQEVRIPGCNTLGIDVDNGDLDIGFERSHSRCRACGPLRLTYIR